MLTMPSKRLWAAATAATAAMLLAGVAAAFGVHALDPDDGYVADGPDGGIEFVDHCPTADPDDECYEEHITPPPGDPDPGSPPGEGGDGRCYFGSDGPITVGDGAEAPNIVLVAAQRREVPCQTEDGFYLDGCYWGPPPGGAQLIPNAPDGDGDEVIWAAWQPEPPPGHEGEDGQWLWGECIWGFIGDTMLFDAAIHWRWFENGAIPIVTPEMVAQDWLALVTLRGMEFDLAPPDGTTGVINLPVWLAAAPDPNPGDRESHWGPIGPEQHCVTGVCIMIGATVVSVDWAMGDGSTETCTRDQHVAWEQGKDYLNPVSYGACHYIYSRSSRDQADGRYTITATTTWEVAWTSEVSDTSGIIDPAPVRTNTASLQIDEIQVLTR
jgi:hypothetical protein